MPKARAVAEEAVALAAAVQGVAPAERAVAPAERVVAPAERAPVLEVLVRGALARVVRPAERVLVQVARVRALELELVQVARVRALERELVQVARVPALELVQVARVPAPALELARVVQPADRAAPVLPARLVVVPGRREQERVARRVLAVAAGPVGRAAERVALKSLRRSCAARRRCIPAPGRMYFSSCGLSAASATTRVKRAVLSSKPW